MWWQKVVTNEVVKMADVMPVVELKSLLEKKKEEIGMLRETVKSELANATIPQLQDDNYLLRYILSYQGNITKACEAVSKALSWRQNHIDFVKKALDSSSADDTVEFPNHVAPYATTIRKLLTAWRHKTTRNGQPLVLVRINCCNFSALSSVVPIDILRDYVLFANEVEFWQCDRLTRETGKVYKTYRLVDLNGLSMKNLDRYFLKFFGAASAMAEFLHPQLVGKTVLVNAPSMVRIVIELLKKCGVSRRALEKIWVCRHQSDSNGTFHGDLDTILNQNDVPSFLNGSCKCSMGCIPGTDNDRSSPLEISIESLNLEIKSKIAELKPAASPGTEKRIQSEKGLQQQNVDTNVAVSDPSSESAAIPVEAIFPYSENMRSAASSITSTSESEVCNSNGREKKLFLSSDDDLLDGDDSLYVVEANVADNSGSSSNNL